VQRINNKNSLCLPLQFQLTPNNASKPFKDLTLVGKGTNGLVYDVCSRNDPSNCRFVAKQAIMENDDFAIQDIYFLSWLSEHLQGRISPRVYDTTICVHEKKVTVKKRTKKSKSQTKIVQTRVATIVMEKFQMDGQQLLNATSKKFEDMYGAERDDNTPTWVLRETDLLKMWEIVLELDRLGIVHGDLKPNQFLFDLDQNRVVITDFGFAGQVSPQSPTATQPAYSLAPVPYTFTPVLGWVVTAFQCGNRPGKAQDLTQDHPIVQAKLLPWLNRWMLDIYLFNWNIYIWSEPNVLRQYGRLDTTLLPRDVELAFVKICPALKSIIQKRDNLRITRNPKKYYILSTNSNPTTSSAYSSSAATTTTRQYKS
jgi:serine/threonine protein kinase